MLIYLPPSGGDLFPISLGYIAASLKRHGIDVILVDLTVKKPKSPKQVIDLTKKFQPQIVGFSSCQVNMYKILAMAKSIKKISRNIFIILGGPQATFMPKAALFEMPPIDALCRGEGEEVLPLLSECLINGNEMETVKNIAFKRKGILIDTKQKEFKDDLDNFPSPYQGGILNFSEHKIGVILSSRGCSFNCHFCYTPNAFNHTIRFHSPQRVLEDLEVCVKNNITNFFFADPSFTFDKERVIEIMRRIIKKRLKICFWCETRADLVDKDMLSIMAKAGARTIAYGLETVDKNVMKAINKKVDLDNFKKVVKITQGLGIRAEVFTLYGLPKQTYESSCKTLEFVKSLNVKIIGNSSGQPLALYFGTKIYDSAKKFGMHFIKKKRPLFLSPATEFETEYMDRQEISLIRKRYKAEQILDRMLLSKEDKHRALYGVSK